MRIVEFISEHGGIAHRRTLLAGGFSRHAMRTAEQADLIRHVRRDWYMIPGCAESTYRAVLAGGSLSCISAAKLAGIWATHDDELHIAASARSGHVDSAVQIFHDGEVRPVMVHWREMPVGVARPAIDSMVALLMNIAECQVLEDAVATIDSALRLGLIREGELHVLAANSRSTKLREAVKFVDGRAGSGIESIPRVWEQVEPGREAGEQEEPEWEQVQAEQVDALSGCGPDGDCTHPRTHPRLRA